MYFFIQNPSKIPFFPQAKKQIPTELYQERQSLQKEMLLEDDNTIST